MTVKRGRVNVEKKKTKQKQVVYDGDFTILYNLVDYNTR